MSFSPRARPHTVNLSFTDQDLTDNYRDESSFNNNSNNSSPRHRHARGDTPLSQAKSKGQSSRTASTSSWTASQRNGLSNLDKLLDFLDEEETEGNQLETRRIERSIATSTPPPVNQSTQPNQQYSSNHRASRSRTHPSNPSFSHSPPYSTTPSTITRPNRDQLNFTARDHSVSYPHEPHSTISHDRSISRITGRRGAEGEELPDSPSPRPGSVAAMRSTAGDRSGVSKSANHSRSHSLLNQELEDPNEEVVGEDREGSMDSIERVAEAALREFDTIVSSSTDRERRGSRSPNDRPRSRFTTISPEPSLPPVHHHSEHLIHSPTQPVPNPSTSSVTKVDPHQINLQLLKESREAQDYISYLQEELRGINQVVGKLRERGQEEEAEEEELYGSNRQAFPAQPKVTRQASPVVEEQLASLNIVKHLIALLPTSSFSSLSNSTLSMSSIASALEFTRRIDSLAYGGVRRREEDVFDKENLERLVGRVALRENA